MSIADPHDKRTFRHFVKLAPDGTIAAAVEVADGLPTPVDGEENTYSEVTDLHPYDFSGVKILARGKAAIRAELRAKNKGRGPRVG